MKLFAQSKLFALPSISFIILHNLPIQTALIVLTCRNDRAQLNLEAYYEGKEDASQEPLKNFNLRLMESCD